MKTIVRQLLGNRDGVTAIEFAFFAIPFTFILIGLVEVGMMSTAGATLQGATDDAARIIRTGQAQKSGDAQTLFEEKLCEKIDLIINCDDLVYEVIKIDDGTGFGGLSENMAAIQPIYDENGILQPRGFDPGAQNSLIIVRVTYDYPLLTPFVAPFLSDEGKSSRRLMSTAIIQNEPYEF